MSLASSAFSSAARSRTFTFNCSQDMKVGAFSLREGEPLRVTMDNRGKFYLSVEWADGSIGPIPAGTVNLLVGEKIVEDESNFHWAGGK